MAPGQKLITPIMEPAVGGPPDSTQFLSAARCSCQLSSACLQMEPRLKKFPGQQPSILQIISYQAELLTTAVKHMKVHGQFLMMRLLFPGSATYKCAVYMLVMKYDV